MPLLESPHQKKWMNRLITKIQLETNRSDWLRMSSFQVYPPNVSITYLPRDFYHKSKPIYVGKYSMHSEHMGFVNFRCLASIPWGEFFQQIQGTCTWRTCALRHSPERRLATWTTTTLPLGGSSQSASGSLITMVIASTLSRVVPLPNGHSWLINGDS